MDLQRLMSLTRQAIDKYHMIESGDHIAVGISGGKDSLTLLYALHGLKRFYPKPFQLSAITVDLGLGNLNLAPIQELCGQLSIPYTVIPTEIGSILFEARKESNPCSLCAKMRKGALNEKAKALGCNKIAYAHHREDLIETMLMSLIYEGRFHAFSPVTYLDRMDLTVIRPLMFVDEMDVIGFKNKYSLPVVKSSCPVMLVPEADVIGFQKKYSLPVCKNPCPVDGHTKREYVKNLTRQLEKENPGVKSRLFRAILEGGIQGWPQL